jgi:hypothetical protein
MLEHIDTLTARIAGFCELVDKQKKEEEEVRTEIITTCSTNSSHMK